MPSIIGPTAPVGTCAPCESHVATMMVVKIAGNTAAMLLAIGSPERESATATPIARPAATPRAASTSGPTRRRPAGAGCGTRLAAMASESPAAAAAAPIHSAVSTVGATHSCATDTRNAAANHAPSAITTVHARRCRRVRMPTRAGTTRQSRRYPAFSTMPTGTNAIERRKRSGSAPPSHRPIAAGTMVVGMLERMPPVRPPRRSTASVARMATPDAASAGHRTSIGAITGQQV
ncbi:MAG: hypothetical protein ACKORL_02860 [Phycisphaerales bacterium]